ncbi:YgeY family selenium metabolism-linked hydrolase [bacterium]|nr:YgeY family selenium metabolism-linked hydrolase [candidate division CSSED10-310 bacterium]
MVKEIGKTMIYKELGDEIRKPMSSFLCDMIRIPSVSCHETDVINRIAAEMRSVGFDDVDVDPFGNVIGRIGNGRRLIAFDAHVDTVDVGSRELWDFDPFIGDIVDDYIRGRGASDQEGGMASMVYAGYLIKKHKLLPPDMTLLMVGSVSEEDCDGLCWRYIIEKSEIRPEMVLITEPTSCRLYRGQRGRMEITATMPGLSAHGSAPERGKNAIMAMAPVIAGIERLAPSLQCDDFLGRGSVTISRIRSTAPSLCSVADSCEIYMDRRLTWGETPDMALEQIRQLDPSGKLQVQAAQYSEPTHTGFVYPVTNIFPAWKTPADHRAVLAGRATHRDLFGCEPEIGRWTFSTNGVSIAGLHGIPCIGFGPGHEEMAHAPNEKVAVDELVTAALFYAFFPEHYMNQ